MHHLHHVLYKSEHIGLHVDSRNPLMDGSQALESCKIHTIKIKPGVLVSYSPERYTM